jgi:hypothetical protein
MKQLCGPFTLTSVSVTDLANSASLIKQKLLVDIRDLEEIQRREDRRNPLLTDSSIKETRELDLLDQITNYQNFLPKYQMLVEELLGKKDDIEKEVAEKRKSDKNVPSEAETKDALREAGENLQKASVGKETVQNTTISSAKAFFEKAKPYVEPLLKAAKIALKLLAL